MLSFVLESVEWITVSMMGDIDFFHPLYFGKHISRVSTALWLFVFHSRMIALEPITTGMYPSASVTINGKFICIVCMFFCFSHPKAEKTVQILFPWNIWPDSQWRFSRYIILIAICPYLDINLKSFRYCNRIKKGIAIFDIIVLSPKLGSRS